MTRRVVEHASLLLRARTVGRRLGLDLSLDAATARDRTWACRTAAAARGDWDAWEAAGSLYDALRGLTVPALLMEAGAREWVATHLDRAESWLPGLQGA